MKSICGRNVAQLGALLAFVAPTHLYPSLALAEAPPSNASTSAFTARPNAINATFGVGTIVGAIGVEYERTIVHWASFGLGAGYGPTGVNLGFSPRFLFSGRNHAFYVGPTLAYSLGERPSYLVEFFTGEDQDRYTGLLWLGADIGYHYRSDGGFDLRYFACIAADAFATTCRDGEDEDERCKHSSLLIIGAGLSLGGAF